MLRGSLWTVSSDAELNADGISIYTRTYVTTDSDQIGEIYLGEEELKVRRIGHDAMIEQDAVHIGHLIPTNLRLAAANRGAIFVAGRTPITVLHMGGRDLRMSFLVVKNLDDADQFTLGRDFVRNFDVMIDLNNGLIRISNPDRKYVKKPINRIITDENKVPISLDRKVKLQLGQRCESKTTACDSKQVCLVPNPNSQSSVI